MASNMDGKNIGGISKVDVLVALALMMILAAFALNAFAGTETIDYDYDKNYQLIRANNETRV